MPTFKREPLTADEANALANSCTTPREKLVIWTLLDTGLRIHELVNLRAENIDWQGHQLIIHGKGKPDPRTGKLRKKRRIVPMPPRTSALLEAWFAQNREIPIGIRGAEMLVKRVANRAKISRPCSPHVLRHTFSVGCIKKGISFPSLQAILGHDHLSTTFIYSNMQPEVALEEFKRKF